MKAPINIFALDIVRPATEQHGPLPEDFYVVFGSAPLSGPKQPTYHSVWLEDQTYHHHPADPHTDLPRDTLLTNEDVPLEVPGFLHPPDFECGIWLWITAKDEVAASHQSYGSMMLSRTDRGTSRDKFQHLMLRRMRTERHSEMLLLYHPANRVNLRGPMMKDGEGRLAALAYAFELSLFVFECALESVE